MNANISIDKNSAVYRQKLVKAARNNLLLAAVFTVLNVALLLFRLNRYFLFSMTLPYWLTYFGYMFDLFRVSTYTCTGLMIAAVPMAVVVLCWLMSRWDHRWLWGGTVMFGLDTLTLLVMILWSGDMTGMLFDIIFHGWVLFTLIRGLVAAYRLRRPVPVMPWEAPADLITEVQADTPCDEECAE